MQNCAEFVAFSQGQIGGGITLVCVKGNPEASTQKHFQSSLHIQLTLSKQMSHMLRTITEGTLFSCHIATLEKFGKCIVTWRMCKQGSTSGILIHLH